jgi:hypothetical protein
MSIEEITSQLRAVEGRGNDHTGPLASPHFDIRMNRLNRSVCVICRKKMDGKKKQMLWMQDHFQTSTKNI